MRSGATGPGRRTTSLAQIWGGHEGVYGGRVIAELAAAVDVVEGMDLLTVHTEFHGTVRAGEVGIDVDVRHQGRMSASVEAVLTQGHERARCTAKLGRVRTGHAGEAVAAPRDLPVPETLPAFEPAYWTRLDHCRLLDLRLVEHAATDRGRTTRVWIRLDDEHPEVAALTHAGRIACIVDGVPPALFFGEPMPAYVPTVDLTLHLRPAPAAPVAGWCYAEAGLVWVTDEFCLEEVTLWSADGDLVGQARQNRRVVLADQVATS